MHSHGFKKNTFILLFNDRAYISLSDIKLWYTFGNLSRLPSSIILQVLSGSNAPMKIFRGYLASDDLRDNVRAPNKHLSSSELEDGSNIS
jgi:hypothetical protein